MSSTAPVNLDFTVYKGQDFTGVVPFVAGANDPAGVTVGTAIPLANPYMQVRVAQAVNSQLILTPTLSISPSNTVNFTFPNASTVNVSASLAYYDIFATRTDISTQVALAYGQITFIPNVTSVT